MRNNLHLHRTRLVNKPSPHPQLILRNDSLQTDNFLHPSKRPAYPITVEKWRGRIGKPGQLWTPIHSLCHPDTG